MSTRIFDDTCCVVGCGRPVTYKQEHLCNAHGLRLYRYGSVFASRPVAGPRGKGSPKGTDPMRGKGVRRWYATSRTEPTP